MTENLDQLLTTSEAARRLGVSSQRVQQLLTAGRLAFVSTPLGRLIDPRAVERLRAERAAAGR